MFFTPHVADLTYVYQIVTWLNNTCHLASELNYAIRKMQMLMTNIDRSITNETLRRVMSGFTRETGAVWQHMDSFNPFIYVLDRAFTESRIGCWRLLTDGGTIFFFADTIFVAPVKGFI